MVRASVCGGHGDIDDATRPPAAERQPGRETVLRLHPLSVHFGSGKDAFANACNSRDTSAGYDRDRTQCKWFSIPRETFNVVIYSFIELFKIVFPVFYVVPYVALLIVG